MGAIWLAPSQASVVLEVVQEPTQILVQTAISHGVSTTKSNEVYFVLMNVVYRSKSWWLSTQENLYSEESGFPPHWLCADVAGDRDGGGRRIRLQFAYRPCNGRAGLKGEGPKLTE